MKKNVSAKSSHVGRLSLFMVNLSVWVGWMVLVTLTLYDGLGCVKGLGLLIRL